MGIMQIYITPDDIAEKLQISKKSVYNLLYLPAENGGIPHIKFSSGGKRFTRRISLDVFNEWLNAQNNL
jgi:excisionase family DNA binding protein